MNRMDKFENHVLLNFAFTKKKNKENLWKIISLKDILLAPCGGGCAKYPERPKKQIDTHLKAPGFPELPISSTMQLPIQTGMSAPNAAVWDGFGSICGPLIV